MRVYCKNCKHRNTWYRENGYLRCCPGEISKFTGQYVEEHSQDLYPESDNGEGDCKDYKRKWWKFWVSQQP